MKDAISIWIPVYNNLQDLKPCLRSIAKNVSIKIIEIIIVDDNSTEDIRAFLTDFVNQDTLGNITHLKYIKNKENKGFPHNANIILDNSTHDIICILNSDTYVCKQALEKLSHALQEDVNTIIAWPSTSSANNIQMIRKYYFNRFCTEEEIIKKANEVELKYKDNHHMYLSQKENHNQIHWFCYCIKKDNINTIWYFDEIYGKGNYEESDYGSRSEYLGYKAVWVKDAYVHHYWQRSWKLRRLSDIKKTIDYILLLLKNWKKRKNKLQKMRKENIKNVTRNNTNYTEENIL